MLNHGAHYSSSSIHSTRWAMGTSVYLFSLVSGIECTWIVSDIVIPSMRFNAKENNASISVTHFRWQPAQRSKPTTSCTSYIIGCCRAHFRARCGGTSDCGRKETWTTKIFIIITMYTGCSSIFTHRISYLFIHDDVESVCVCVCVWCVYLPIRNAEWYPSKRRREPNDDE